VVGFLTIFGASLAAYAGLGPWVIGAATVGLAALSYAERFDLHRRAMESGAAALSERTMLSSLGNGLLATTAAYGFGYAMGLI